MPYETLIPDARAFLRALSKNNNRDWWQGNKARYDAQLKVPALALLADLTPQIASLGDLPVTAKLFRPHRDVRFSKDKTPYKTHLHMMWTLETGARQDVVFFFGIGRDYITAGAGRMGFDKPVLEDWRKFVDLDTDRVQGIIADVTAKGAVLREPALKRVPPPYPKDHPAAELLRMKGLVAQMALPPQGDLVPQIMTAFRDLWPINALLIQVAEA